MGIKGLADFLRKKCPQVYQETLLSSFRGKNIAIDANNWMHVNMYFANINSAKDLDITNGQQMDPALVLKNWIDMCMGFTAMWLEHKIVPIYVFDGAYPIEKISTQTGRREAIAKRTEEIAVLREQIKNETEPFAAAMISDRVKKLLSQDTTISKENTQIMINTLKATGIPVIVAPGEAEKFCAYLNICGYADAIFTSDSDAICYGAECIIKKIQGRTDNNDLVLLTITRKDVLKQLGISYETFIDLCIMAGCDYNTNIPGLGIGKAFPILQIAKRIENLDPLKYKTDCLKFEVCRRLFRHGTDVIDGAALKLNKDQFISTGVDTLNKFGLNHHSHRFAKLLMPDTMTFEVLQS